MNEIVMIVIHDGRFGGAIARDFQNTSGICDGSIALPCAPVHLAIRQEARDKR
jgi:hypothetical protein